MGSDGYTYGQERGRQTLNSKGLFYTAVSGIWQTIWLEPVPQRYIQSFRLTPDIDREDLTIYVEASKGNRGLTVEAIAYEDGDPIASGISGHDEVLKLNIANPRFW